MKITAGLPAKYSFTLPNHSAADGWTLSGNLSDSDGSYELASGLFTGDGTAWTLRIPSGTTTQYEAGDVMLSVIADDGNGTEETALLIPARIMALGAVSHNQKMVTALEALMEGRTDKAYESLTTTDGESITRLDPEKLQQWLTFYEGRLAAEKGSAGASSRVRTVQVGF